MLSATFMLMGGTILPDKKPLAVRRPQAGGLQRMNPPKKPCHPWTESVY